MVELLNLYSKYAWVVHPITTIDSSNQTILAQISVSSDSFKVLTPTSPNLLLLPVCPLNPDNTLSLKSNSYFNGTSKACKKGKDLTPC